MKKRTLRFCLALAVAYCFAGLTNCSFAQFNVQEGVYPRIVTRDNVGLSGSATFAASTPFNAVVALGDGFGQYCTGVLVSPNTVLTARHCTVGVNDQVRFGTNFNSPTFTATVSSVWNAPGSGLLSGSDFSILRLNQNVSSAIATPLRLIDGTAGLVGMQVAMVGFGDRGVGSTGATGFDGNRCVCYSRTWQHRCLVVWFNLGRPLSQPIGLDFEF